MSSSRTHNAGNEAVSKVTEESHSSSSSHKESSSTSTGPAGGTGTGHSGTGTGSGTSGSGTGGHDSTSRHNPSQDTNSADASGNKQGGSRSTEDRNSDGNIPGEPLEKNHKASVNPRSHERDHVTDDHTHTHDTQKEGVGSKIKNAFHHDKKTAN